MANSRTTIMANDKLIERVNSHVSKSGESLTSFYNRAIINQLEKDGDFDIRDIVEEDNDAC